MRGASRLSIGSTVIHTVINNICEVSKVVRTTLFADDANLLCCGNNLEQLLDIVEKELGRMKNWFDENKLTLNLSKTKFMIFGNRSTKSSKKLMINDVEIKKVNEIKFLGVIIDNKLSWKPHIHYIKTKISKSTAILNKAKDLLNQASLYTLYCSFILPYMCYCVEVWGNTYKTNIDPIFILQKRAIRIVNKTKYREPTNPLFNKLKILKFRDLVDFKTIQFMYKVKNCQLPAGIQELFQIRESGYNLRGSFMFKKPPVRTNMKYHSVTVRGVTLWNDCSDEMKACKHIQTEDTVQNEDTASI